MAPFRTTKRRLAVTAAAAVAAIGVFVGLGPTPGGASSHREAPLIAADPQADNTDLYAFVSPDTPNKVTIISNFIPFEEPAGGPNFYQFGTGVRYDVRIDNNGDARPDVVYRWTFHNHIRNPDTFLYNTGPVTSLDDPDLNMYQTYDVQRIERRLGEDRSCTTRSPSRAASAPRRCRTTTVFATTASCRPTRASTSPDKPTTRSSPICACSTCCTAATCPRRGTTPWRGTT